jgi:hypothetical protein
VLVSSNNEFSISIPRLKCRHVEVAEVEVVEEEVMRLQGIREEDVVEEDNQSKKLEDKDPKKSN